MFVVTVGGSSVMDLVVVVQDGFVVDGHASSPRVVADMVLKRRFRRGDDGDGGGGFRVVRDGDDGGEGRQRRRG
ncbi:hypothetical protein DAI22_03g176400 [Oryza sativa Japonica Group]|nr:hypothetical protein DAI22_03g176400 [Oryza sativa Japonica Group]